MIGPLTVPPNCFWSSWGFGAVGESKKFLASQDSLRPKMKPAPWNSLLPDLLTRLIWFALKPYSAEYVLFCWVNCSRASTDRITAGGPVAGSVFAVPAVMKVFDVGRAPCRLIASPTPRRLLPCSPARRAAPAVPDRGGGKVRAVQ